jgi:undecaprenyl-diphosphatase
LRCIRIERTAQSSLAIVALFVLRGRMSGRARHTISIVSLAAIWLAMLLLGRGQLDRNIYEALYAGGHPALITAARVVTTLGEHIVLIIAAIILALWLWWAGRGRMGVTLLALIMTGRILAELQKLWIVRARPTLEPHLVVVNTWSFPSGHATNSMIFYLTLALAFTGRTRWRWIAAGSAILLSLLIGTSRVMLGVHWPSDVIGGWSFGLLWVLVTLPRAERLFAPDSAGSDKQPSGALARGAGD